ncbi:CU044_2847 family protein [Roseibium sp.]|uniref:CU044_2847 family protein n=1 Tax=Roseibium sp. TaxID=1936156 RepID=UPI003BA9B96D
MSEIAKLDVGDGKFILVEADDIAEEQPKGRAPASPVSEMAGTLASSFDQFRAIFEIAQHSLDGVIGMAEELKIEMAAKLTTSGNLVIVKGTGEASIKVTLTWKGGASG